MPETLPLFHPYKIVAQTRGMLQLSPEQRKETTVRWLRFIPLFVIGVAVMAALLAGDDIASKVVLFTAIPILLVIPFIKVPVDMQMDGMGLNIETASVKGITSAFYLWNDVDYIRYQITQVKESKTLQYQAVLKDGKKRQLLSFNTYDEAKDRLYEMNEVLAAVSRKEVKPKT